MSDVYEVPKGVLADLRISMKQAARELLGGGYVDEYYESAASDLTAIAEHYLRTAPRKKVKK